jgi:phosphatidylglycerophosphate synthase
MPMMTKSTTTMTTTPTTPAPPTTTCSDRTLEADPPTVAIDAASAFTSIVMLAATAASLGLAQSAPVAVGVPLLAGLCAWLLPRLGRPRTWWPTAVTGLRLVLTGALAIEGLALSGWVIAATVFTIFMLDGVDGSIARRTNSVSRLGAHLDMETDALLVMTVCVLHFLRGPCGAWVLTAGLLRYVYVLVVRVWPSQGQAPRSRLGASAFGIGLMSLMAGFLPVPILPVLGPVLATAVLGWSFGRSFYWSFRTP